MAERKELVTIEYISDDDCGMYVLGEISTLTGEAVERHIKVYGENGYEAIRDLGIRLLVEADLQIKLFRKYETKQYNEIDKRGKGT